MFSLVTLFLAPASAADISLPPVKDSVVGRAQGQRGWSASSVLYMGWAQNRNRRPIVEFDLDAVPSTSTVTGAELTLDVLSFQGVAQPVTVHAVSQSWVEGTEVAGVTGSSSPTGVSWNFRDNTNGLSWAGGGAFGPAIGTGTVTGTGTVAITLDAGVVDDMASGVLADHGFIVVSATSGPSDRISIRSKESGAPGVLLDLELDGPPDNLDSIVAEMAVGVNTLLPGFIDEGASSLRRRPSTIESNLRGAVDQLVADGCVVDTVLENYSFGTYAGGTVTAAHVTGAESGTLNGSYSVSPKSFSGTMLDAGGVGVDHTFGDVDSGFADLRLGADYSTGTASGFVVGLAIRDQGTQGAFVGLHGVCEGLGDPGAGVNAWLGTNVFPTLD